MNKELVCEKRDGFWFYSIFHYNGAALIKEAIIIDEKETKKFVSYINKKNIDKVIIDLFHSDIESLSFLKNIKHIKYLVIWGNGVIDNSPIYELTNLKFLKILRPSELDINRVKSLEFFSTTEPGKIINIEHATSLKTLELINTTKQGSYNDLTFLSKLYNLDTLLLSNFNITTLEGIENLTKLKVLILEDMKKLENINSLTSLSSSLRRLQIYKCNRICSFDPIKELNKLVFLSMDSVKLVPNIEFISNLKKLCSFILWESNVINGNMTPLTFIDHALVYPIRQHYYIIKQGVKIAAKETDFKYGERNMGDEDIELWRRISY